MLYWCLVMYDARDHGWKIMRYETERETSVDRISIQPEIISTVNVCSTAICMGR